MNPLDPQKFPDVDIYQSPLKDSSSVLYILRGGWNNPFPKLYMDEVVREFVGSTLHNQFIEIHLDIPQVRVIIVGINDLPYHTTKELFG